MGRVVPDLWHHAEEIGERKKCGEQKTHKMSLFLLVIVENKANRVNKLARFLTSFSNAKPFKIVRIDKVLVKFHHHKCCSSKQACSFNLN